MRNAYIKNIGWVALELSTAGYGYGGRLILNAYAEHVSEVNNDILKLETVTI